MTSRRERARCGRPCPTGPPATSRGRGDSKMLKGLPASLPGSIDKPELSLRRPIPGAVGLAAAVCVVFLAPTAVGAGCRRCRPGTLRDVRAAAGARRLRRFPCRRPRRLGHVHPGRRDRGGPEPVEHRRRIAVPRPPDQEPDPGDGLLDLHEPRATACTKNRERLQLPGEDRRRGHAYRLRAGGGKWRQARRRSNRHGPAARTQLASAEAVVCSRTDRRASSQPRPPPSPP